MPPPPPNDPAGRQRQSTVDFASPVHDMVQTDFARSGALASQALAGELDAMGLVQEARSRRVHAWIGQQRRQDFLRGFLRDFQPFGLLLEQTRFPVLVA
jgi:hypothetical protein